jgi:hypothetical protein
MAGFGLFGEGSCRGLGADKQFLIVQGKWPPLEKMQALGFNVLE